MFKKAVLSRMMVWTLVLAGAVGLVGVGPVLAQGKSSIPLVMAPDLGVLVVNSAYGARIDQVANPSLAATLGLRPYDRITAVNGRPVDANHSLEARLSASGITDGLMLTVMRQGQALTMQLTQADIDAMSGGVASLAEHMQGVIEAQTLARLSSAAAAPAMRTTQVAQSSIGQSLSLMGGNHPAWMSSMLGALHDFFAGIKVDVSTGTN